MEGVVDARLRALVRVPVSASRGGPRSELLAWIDTAFNGTLTIPRERIAGLGLTKHSTAEAVLADGSCFELETFSCHFDWFGNCYETQVVTSDGEHALLGTMLLDGHRLSIDHSAKTVELT